MNQEPQSIWKRPLCGAGDLLLAWLVLMIAGFIIGWPILWVNRAPNSGGQEFGLIVAFDFYTTLIYLLVLFIRWLCSWRNLKRFVFGLACFFTLIALFYAEEDWRGWHAWNQFKHTGEAKGEYFTLASVTPPPVPDDQNFALTPIAFTSYGQLLARDGKLLPYPQRDQRFVIRMRLPVTLDYDTPTNCDGDRVRGKFTNLEGWQSYYRQLAVRTNAFPAPSHPQSPAADVLFALSKYATVIEELRAASQLPDSRFPLNYDSENPAGIFLPHLNSLKSCAQGLRLRSVAELQNNQPDQALRDVQLGLQLAGKIQTEPFLISHLVRAALLQIMLQPVWEGLAERHWSDSQLAALDTELAQFDFPASYRLAMRGEIGLQCGEMDDLRRHPDRWRDIAADFSDQGQPEFVSRLISDLIPTGWLYQNQLHCVRTIENYYLPVADADQGVFFPDRATHGGAMIAADTKSLTPFNLLERLYLPALGNAAVQLAYAQASADLARTAIALERYRLAHGAFPESLEALTPQFLAQAPHDVIGGQPLKYRLTSDGQFVLYSIGWDEQDDGGVVVFGKGKTPSMDKRHGDWVWTYPPRQ